MSERKVLNKYYPPDFDPSKIPKMRGPKNRTFSIRIMAPFNMRCNTCGEYIYKGKKFNSRKENVEDDDYLGLRIFRFYIKCPRCVAEIAFKTDLKNTDYTLEAGATRLFEAEKLAQKMAEQERKEKEEEELNPMKVLENRTKQSRNELEQLDTLEELRDLNARQARINFDDIIGQHQALTAQDRERLQQLQEEEDARMARELLAVKRKELPDPDSDEEDQQPPRKLLSSASTAATVQKPTDLLTQPVGEKPKSEPWSNGTAAAAAPKKTLQSKSGMAKLIVLKKKPAAAGDVSTTAASTASNTTTPTSTAASSAVNGTAPSAATSGTGASNGPAACNGAAEPVNGEQGGTVRNAGTGLSSKTSQPAQPKTGGASLGLGLLGNYSDSDASDASD